MLLDFLRWPFALPLTAAKRIALRSGFLFPCWKLAFSLVFVSFWHVHWYVDNTFNPRQAKSYLRCICELQTPRSAYTFTQSDHSLYCPLTESWHTIKCTVIYLSIRTKKAKQSRLRSNDTERGSWWESTLFATDPPDFSIYQQEVKCFVSNVRKSLLMKQCACPTFYDKYSIKEKPCRCWDSADAQHDLKG